MPEDGVRWGFQKISGVWGGLEDFVPLFEDFIERLEALVVSGDEADFLIRFRFRLTWVGLLGVV